MRTLKCLVLDSASGFVLPRCQAPDLQGCGVREDSIDSRAADAFRRSAMDCRMAFTIKQKAARIAERPSSSCGVHLGRVHVTREAELDGSVTEGMLYV